MAHCALSTDYWKRPSCNASKDNGPPLYEGMASITDPATELSSLASNLLVATSHKGAQFLAEKFGVGQWSTEFFKIVSCILARADVIADIVNKSDLDDINKTTFNKDIDVFKSCFSGGVLVNPWNSGGGLAAMTEQGTRLGLIQGTVRPIVNYPRLTEDEITELLELIDAYLTELDLNTDGPQFVRQAIRDGLLSFRFQLKHVGWMGSGYLLKEFRSLVEIYKQASDYYGQIDNFDPGAVLKGMWAVIERFRGVVETVKPYTDAGSYLWAGYSVVSPFFPMLAAPLLKLAAPTG